MKPILQAYRELLHTPHAAENQQLPAAESRLRAQLEELTTRMLADRASADATLKGQQVQSQAALKEQEETLMQQAAAQKAAADAREAQMAAEQKELRCKLAEKEQLTGTLQGSLVQMEQVLAATNNTHRFSVRCQTTSLHYISISDTLIQSHCVSITLNWPEVQNELCAFMCFLQQRTISFNRFCSKWLLPFHRVIACGCVQTQTSTCGRSVVFLSTRAPEVPAGLHATPTESSGWER